MKISLLVSGGLGCEVLNHMISRDENLVCVFTDKSSDEIQEICKYRKIPVFVGNPRQGRGAKFLQDYNLDLILSINYLFIIENDLYNQAPIACNIHGSLLPKYRGRTPHVWAIINNEKEAGITAHLIDDGCDTGDIISQVKVPVLENDTGADILSKYKAQYLPLVDDILEKIHKGCLKSQPQDHSKATYFGKRSPEDGRINWDWQKERIRNWVRAQSFPYPGAFTFWKEKKIIIDWVDYSELGFEDSIPNGTLLALDPFQVKTPNGVLKITKIRRTTVEAEIGNKFR
jgi:methionyl-tRNA formyltransferase